MMNQTGIDDTNRQRVSGTSGNNGIQMVEKGRRQAADRSNRKNCVNLCRSLPGSLNLYHKRSRAEAAAWIWMKDSSCP